MIRWMTGFGRKRLLTGSERSQWLRRAHFPEPIAEALLGERPQTVCSGQSYDLGELPLLAESGTNPIELDRFDGQRYRYLRRGRLVSTETPAGN